MKFLKTFEKYLSNRLDNSIINNKVGTIVEESSIYQYIETLHHTQDDFIDGDLPRRIEWYPQYKLILIPIDRLDTDEFYWDETEVDKFKDLYLETNKYPPIVIAHDFSIIDGTHRLNALEQLGEKKILAYMGIGNDKIYDPFEDY